MLGKNIDYKNFNFRKSNLTQKNKISKFLKDLINEDNQILASLSKNYKNSYNKKLLLKFKKKSTVMLIGIGGSILGARAIYSFLRPKVKKFVFVDGFQEYETKSVFDKKKLNVIISKSGNTLETISNTNTLINKRSTNIFITENKKSYLMDIANKLKSEVVHHNNFIGGRYSVLSEVGMLPAELMGFNSTKFRRLNQLIKNKSFLNTLILNVSNTLNLIKSNKLNSIILNYDDRSENLFKWYQQLVAESLGKKGKGVLPVVSSMPKDNHSLMQYYLDGTKNNFYTFFFVKEKNSKKIKNNELLNSHYYLKGKSLNDISYSQFIATQKVFKKKNIPYRSFVVKKRCEETLGELFIFFILETILLAKATNINPYNQPAVELIKSETKNILIKS